MGAGAGGQPLGYRLEHLRRNDSVITLICVFELISVRVMLPFQQIHFANVMENLEPQPWQWARTMASVLQEFKGNAWHPAWKLHEELSYWSLQHMPGGHGLKAPGSASEPRSVTHAHGT